MARPIRLFTLIIADLKSYIRGLGTSDNEFAENNIIYIHYITRDLRSEMEAVRVQYFKLRVGIELETNKRAR